MRSLIKYLSLGFLFNLLLGGCAPIEGTNKPKPNLDPNLVACETLKPTFVKFWNGAVSYWNWDVVLTQYTQTGIITDKDTPSYLAEDLRDDWEKVERDLGDIPADVSGPMLEVRNLMLNYISDEYLFIWNMENSLEQFKIEQKKIDLYCD